MMYAYRIVEDKDYGLLKRVGLTEALVQPWKIQHKITSSISTFIFC